MSIFIILLLTFYHIYSSYLIDDITQNFVSKNIQLQLTNAMQVNYFLLFIYYRISRGKDRAH